MATLYLARRYGAAGFSRLVALKVIRPQLVTQPTFVEMFIDEARICAQLNHPNIVRVEEFGVLDGVHCLVMEYLDGCSVGEWLQSASRERRKLDPELVARVIMQIATGLHAAHETRDQDGQPLDIIHRDISPSNILLSVDGNAKLIDFGIAKARHRLSRTQAGIAKGKYKYIAPEQVTGPTVDRRCDIFSLGVVFWEMLTGKPLFNEDTQIGLFNRLKQTNVVPPSAVNPEVPAILDPIVLAMLRHDPAERPQTAAEVQRRIASVMPRAANREDSELGAIAVEIRDKRATRRAASATADLGSHINFSPTPRSVKTSGDDYLEIEASLTSELHGPTVRMATASLPLRRRGMKASMLVLLGIVVTVGILLGGALEVWR